MNLFAGIGRRRGPKRKKINPAVGPAVLAARRSLRLTRGAFGALVGVQWRAIGRWEEGEAEPPPKTKARLVKAVEAQKASAGRTLAAALGLERLVAPPPPPPSPEALRLAVLRLADTLDVSPSRARRACAQLLEQARAARFTLEAAAREIDEWAKAEDAARTP